MNERKKLCLAGHGSRILVAAHRGARFTHPENTMHAFRHAIEQGVDMIETDVRMTKDRQLVLMHDPTVDRTTNGSGTVCDMTLAEFKALNAAVDYGDYPEGVAPPTLDEFMKLCAAHETLINFELKDYPKPGREEWAYECCDRLVGRIEAYGYRERCVLNSFSARLLEYVAKKYDGRYLIHGYYPNQALQDSDHEDASFYRRYFFCAGISGVEYRPDGAAQKKAFDAVLAEGIEPWIFSNSTREIIQASRLGAGMITTDYPAAILEELRRLGYHD